MLFFINPDFYYIAHITAMRKSQANRLTALTLTMDFDTYYMSTGKLLLYHLQFKEKIVND